MHDNNIVGRQSFVSGGQYRISLKERRQRLFRKSRPFIRQFTESDMGWLWVAYLKGSFKIPDGLTQPEFASEVGNILGRFENFIVDDDNPKFKGGRGPVALICVSSDGWKYEPAIAFFKWATPKNMLRVSVSFFHKSSLSSKVGVCIVKWGKSVLLDHLKKYGVLFPRGRIPMGCANGDEFIYSVLGRKGSEAQKANR